MLFFQNDYSEGAHPKVLQALVETNKEKLPGYGSDRYCQRAAEKIKQACACEHADVFFLSGGTQTNLIVIDSLCDDICGVIAAHTGHISSHEAGAIEKTGHKVLTLPEHEGKIWASELDQYMKDFYNDRNHSHMVYPGMVYISHPTEYGTLYTRNELEALAEICREYSIPLYLDGARLGYGLMAKDTDVDLPCIAQTCDVFYIGGTKIGALCGEAVVFTRNTPSFFTTRVKQHGGLMAKGRLLGVQFATLFTDNLYLDISGQAIAASEALKEILHDKKIQFYVESPTNQQFIIMENEKLKRLAETVVYSFWEKYDDHKSVIRLATSWATTMDDVRALKEYL